MVVTIDIKKIYSFKFLILSFIEIEAFCTDHNDFIFYVIITNK